MLGGYIGVGQSNPWLSTAAFLTTVICLFLLVGLFIALARLDSPVEEMYRTGDNKQEFVPIASLLFGILPLFFAVLLLDGYAQVFTFGIILVGLVGYDRYQARIAELSFAWQRRLVQQTRQLPLIAANYVVLLFLASLILLMFIFTYQSSLFLDLITALPLLAPILFSLFELVLLGMIIVVIREAWRSEAERFRQHGRNIRSRKAINITSFVVIVASAVFVFISYEVLQGVVLLLQVYDSIGVYWYLTVTILPIGFIGGGLCYQVASVGVNFFQLYRKAESRDLSDVLDVEAETYVVDHDGLFAGAASFIDDYILISNGVINSLDDPEIAAVLAHEEAHLKHREARLALLIAILSPLVFTGKNILYAILDFRAREYRADECAVSRLGDRKQVVDALEALQRVKISSLETQFSGVTPTLVPMDADDDDSSIVTRVFGFYYGNFAFSQVHPDLESRQDELRETAE